MSALWTLGRLRDRLCGDTVAGLGSLIQGAASLFPSWPWLLLRCPKVVFSVGSGPSPALSRSSPRGSGSTGQGLCALHEDPTYLECTRPSSSGPRPSCSTGQAPPDRLRAVQPAPASTACNDHRARCVGALRCHGLETLGGYGTAQPSGSAEAATALRALRTRGGRRRDGMLDDAHRASKGAVLSSDAPAARSGPTPWRPRPGAGRRWRPRCRWGAWCRPRRPR